jgi:hypothetical protein
VIDHGRRQNVGSSDGGAESRLGPLILYGVVSAKTERVVEFFLERDAAEAIIVEVRGDDPDLADVLCVDEVELG